MKRKIIKIDNEKCDGCGLCAEACHEGAIEMIDGKAHLTREDYCDGLGNCLPACPQNAIAFEEREALPFNEQAATPVANHTASCPGTQTAKISGSCLSQWPIQIKLVPVNAPYFNNASILIAADCTAYSYGNFHANFMKDKITLIGCPKLDDTDYAQKLSQIISNNNIKDITVVRMEVPCCGGIEYATKVAVQSSGKDVPMKVVTISIDGEILSIE